MSYALYLTPFILIFGVIFFLVSSRYLLKDEYNCKIEMTGSEVSSNGTQCRLKAQSIKAYDNFTYLQELPPCENNVGDLTNFVNEPIECPIFRTLPDYENDFKSLKF